MAMAVVGSDKLLAETIEDVKGRAMTSASHFSDFTHSDTSFYQK